MKEAVSASWEGFDPLSLQMASTVLTTIVPLYCSNGRPEPALNYYSSNLKRGVMIMTMVIVVVMIAMTILQVEVQEGGLEFS